MNDGGYADIAVLTIVPEAYKAALRVFDAQETKHRFGQPYAVAHVEAVTGGTHRVVVDLAPDRANQAALETTGRLIRAWTPRVLLLADIAAGIWGNDAEPRDGVALGDVVVASNLEYYESVKELKDDTDDPRQFFQWAPPSRGPRAAFNLYRLLDAEWHAAIEATRPAEGEPKILPGEILVGEKLLTNPSSDLVRKLVARYPKALALDMESVGVAAAIYAAQQEQLFLDFAILRGVSDFLDKEGLDNQKTRDAWKPYAAEAAVAAAHAFVRNRPAEGDTTPTLVAAYVRDFRAQLQQVGPHEATVFPLNVTTADRGNDPTPTAPGYKPVPRYELLDTFLEERRCVIYGPSGAGKSSSLLHVAAQVAPLDDPLVVLVDLKQFKPEWVGELPSSVTADAVRPAIDLLLRPVDISVERLDGLAEARDVVLMVDAMNEVGGDAARRLLTALDEYVRHHERVHVVVADRRADLFYQDTRWRILHLEGLTREDAQAIVDAEFGEDTYEALEPAERDLLTLPFFLDVALHTHDPRLGSRTEAVRSFLRGAGLEDDELDELAAVAFHAYQGHRSYVDDSEVQRLRETQLYERLDAAAVVVHRTGQATFSHQLVHQYLAAQYIATRCELWTPDNLDAITAYTSSLDAVGLALVLISTVEARDQFLNGVHDWNWRATLLALREAKTAGAAVSDALEIAVLAGAAEKRFDPLQGTRERVEGQLPAVGTNHALRMAEVPTLAELLAYVGQIDIHDPSGWYDEWKTAFLRTPDGGALTEADLQRVTHPDSVIGWTGTNATRRFSLSEVDAALLRGMHAASQGEDPHDRAVRWRVAHTLGVHPSRTDAEFLLRVIDTDEYRWCRYGAVRSVVEMAARTDDMALREWILDELDRRLATIDTDPLGELAWAALYEPATAGWADAIRPVLERIRDMHPEDTSEREVWDRRLDRFERYAASVGL